MIRNGEVVLERALGLADRAVGTRNTHETIFAIGSTPIDFTKVGLLLLIERGKLRTDQCLTDFFDDVSADKASITVECLMAGRSGLRDFHDLPSDGAPDHAWIDRAEAVRRILDQELLFEPGTQQEHSHSAWGLLAVILELASGESYQEFTRTHLFEPAGMTSTGFFGERWEEASVAIGYGERSEGKVNSPDHWGRTSWLVMGSGGMVSTTGDMVRWLEALHGGVLLGSESLDSYWSPPGRVLAGGDTYGFEIAYSEGPETLFVLTSNAIDRTNRGKWETLVADLAGLVHANQKAPFAVGVRLHVDGSTVSILDTVPGGPAYRGGLEAGDVILSVNGRKLQPNPKQVLHAALLTGAPIAFTVQRGRTVLTRTMEPEARQ